MTTNASDTSTRCPRCGGNLRREFDWLTGWEAACLQCGFRGPVTPSADTVYETAQRLGGEPRLPEYRSHSAPSRTRQPSKRR